MVVEHAKMNKKRKQLLTKLLGFILNNSGNILTLPIILLIIFILELDKYNASS